MLRYRYLSLCVLLVAFLATPVAVLAQTPQAVTVDPELAQVVDSLRFDLTEAAKKPKRAKIEYDEVTDNTIVRQFFYFSRGHGFLSLDGPDVVDGDIAFIFGGKAHAAADGLIALKLRNAVGPNDQLALRDNNVLYVLADGQRFSIESDDYGLRRDGIQLVENVTYMLKPLHLLALANSVDVKLKVGPFEFRMDNRAQKAFQFVTARFLTDLEVE